MKPYRQGSLDSCCGIYSLINATKLVVDPFSLDDAVWIFQECFAALEKKGAANKAASYGIGIKYMLILLKTVVQPAYPVWYARPFSKTPKLPMPLYWKFCQTFLARENRAIIVAAETWAWSHWTVIRKISDKQLFLFDSDNRKILNRCRCSTTGIKSSRPVSFYPSVTIFMSSVEDSTR